MGAGRDELVILVHAYEQTAFCGLTDGLALARDVLVR
jgi:hypothetical protein